ncbi:MAG: DUF5078 domain-containing protein [Mycobacteriaceae bacterium]|nr:DUF5078 domain-containing protein [Mycobacteriaceae bacterium]
MAIAEVGLGVHGSPAPRCKPVRRTVEIGMRSPMTASWPNWAKVFFNNKGVAAKETDHCA